MKKMKIILVILLCLLFIPITYAEEINLNESNTVYFEDVFNAGKDTGYSKKTSIKKGDPHYGWKLGKFAISGFSGKSTDEKGNVVLLKNINDKVSLYFILSQNINEIDGNKNLIISTDKDGYDNEFNIKQTNFGKGTLIIRKIDSTGNKNEPQVYVNYLKGVKVGANTKIDVFEEGDYEVALDYEIKEDGFAFFNSYHNYRIRFNFSIRNGNCMVFPFDVKTKNELINTSITENGFYLDFANSKYLNVNIKKEVLKEGANGLIEDTRFNRPAKAGEKYTEEGIYTITVKNIYTEEQTVKKIYVGQNNVLKAHAQTGYSINDIQNMIKLGATIDENGYINNIPNEYLMNDSSLESSQSSKIKSDNMVKHLPILIAILLSVIFIVFKLIEKRKENELIKKKIEEKEKILKGKLKNNKTKEENKNEKKDIKN